MLRFFDGKKTFIAGYALIAFGVLGYVTGKTPAPDAFQCIFEGLGLVGLRHALLKQ